MAIDFNVVIPARYASTRLHGKPLLDIAGKPMVIHVVEQAIKSGSKTVIVATDNNEILDTVNSYGFDAMLTSESHLSGTDRIAEVAQKMGWSQDEIIVNVQGDEPLIEPNLIIDVATNLSEHVNAAIATACHPIHDKSSMFNPNIVKLVMDSEGYALYFSRAPIPYDRDAFALGLEVSEHTPVYRHLGIYAYRASFLAKFSDLKPSEIEKAESLEQLRALWYGYKISVAVVEAAPSIGVDTHEDLLRVRNILNSN